MRGASLIAAALAVSVAAPASAAELTIDVKRRSRLLSTPVTIFGKLSNHPDGVGGRTVNVLEDSYPFGNDYDWFEQTTTDAAGNYRITRTAIENTRYRAALVGGEPTSTGWRTVYVEPIAELLHISISRRRMGLRYLLETNSQRDPGPPVTAHFYFRPRGSRVYRRVASKRLVGCCAGTGLDAEVRFRTPRRRGVFAVCTRVPPFVYVGRPFEDPACGRRRIRR